ncbi:DUF2625 family protein [Streptomyces sp. NPDC001536]|uniref:DUF2625 family protein n=1 Tax=Streptomyces sp. NPDC001536 TaxID=3364583 RepID=UPI003691F123
MIAAPGNGHDPAASGRPGSPGQTTCFAPDTLAWEAMDMGHSAWVHWLLSRRLETFYGGLRRPGWREEAHADPAANGWRAVPMREVCAVAADFARQLGPADPGFLGDV